MEAIISLSYAYRVKNRLDAEWRPDGGCDGIRLCLQSGKDLTSPTILSDVISLVIFVIVATPIALYVFKMGCNAARRDVP